MNEAKAFLLVLWWLVSDPFRKRHHSERPRRELDDPNVVYWFGIATPVVLGLLMGFWHQPKTVKQFLINALFFGWSVFCLEICLSAIIEVMRYKIERRRYWRDYRPYYPVSSSNAPERGKAETSSRS